MSNMEELRFVQAWRRDDPRCVADAKAFWRQMGMTDDVAEQRAGELCVVAYLGENLAGVSTAKPREFEPLKARFVHLRCAVSPAARRKDVAARIIGHTRTVLEAWAADNPDEKLAGMLAVLQSNELREKQREPIWPIYGIDLTLIGYTSRGEQIRVGWFRHARLD
jgi:hypothetical protein